MYFFVAQLYINVYDTTMHPLLKYIKKNDKTVSAFAARASMKQPTIWRIINLKGSPTIKTLLKIEKETRGEVKVEDLVSYYSQYAQSNF